MIARSVFEMIHRRSPASFAARSAGTVSGNGCQLSIERARASPSRSFQR